jgi:hypothetical protein
MTLTPKTSSTKPHPLRPLENPVLVCEGESDFSFLQQIFNQIAPDVLVYYATGKNNVATLSAIFSPATYVVDRDYDTSSADARMTLTAKKPKTIFPAFDIEGYLLWEDWIMAYVEATKPPISPSKFRKPPVDEAQITRDICEVADMLATDHAGGSTIAGINRAINNFNLDINQGGKLLKKGAETNTDAVWQQHLTNEVQRLSQARQDFSDSNICDLPEILSQYQTQLAHYKQWATSLEQIRLEFSGKRILQILAVKWDLRAGGKPWHALRDGLIDQAIAHLKKDNNSARFADFKLLADKVQGKI